MLEILAVVWLSFVSLLPQTPETGEPMSDGSPAATAVTIQGEVASTDGPIAGAKVFLFREQMVGQSETGVDGKFKIELDSDAAVNVFVFAAGRVSHVQTLAPKQQAAPKAPSLEFTLAKEKKAFGGRIIDYQGMGVADAKLRISTLVHNGETIAFASNLEIEHLETVTDKNGAFQFAGIQSAMVASINVTGDDIASATLNAGSFTREIVLVAGPCRSVKCQVVDRVSGKPIPNVRGGASQVVLGFQAVQPFQSPAVYSDANGEFELKGLPAFQPVNVVAEPTGDKPYLRSMKQVPIENGFDVTQVRLELEPAVWSVCKVREFGSDGPAVAEVFYFPTPENEKNQTFVESFLVGGQRLAGKITDSDGVAKIAALPGPGAIAIAAAGFPANESVNKLTEEQRAMLFQVAQRDDFTAIEWIDPKTLDDKIEFDFLVSKGRSIDIAVSEKQVSPNDHLVVHRAKSKTSRAEHVTGAKFSAQQFQPGETRVVLIQAPQKKMGAAVEIKAEADSPLSVELRPTGSLTGQIVDSDGRLQQGLVVEIAVAGSDVEDNFYDVMRIITDANGRYNAQSLIADLEYRISAVRLTQNRQMMDGAPQVDSRWVVAESLQINENELVDLGAVEFGASERPKPERRRDIETVASESSMPTLISGKIVNTDDEPVVGATISFNTWPERTGDMFKDGKLKPIVLAESRSDADGYFQLPLDSKLEKKVSPAGGRAGSSAIVVVADKRGTVQVATSGIENARNLNVQMNRDKVVRGKITSSQDEQEFRVEIGQKMDVYDGAAIQKIIEGLRAGKSLQAVTGNFEPIAKLDPLRGGLPLGVDVVGSEPFLFRGIPINAIFELHVFHDSALQKTITVVSRPHAAIEIKLLEDSTAVGEFHGSRINLKLEPDLEKAADGASSKESSR